MKKRNSLSGKRQSLTKKDRQKAEVCSFFSTQLIDFPFFVWGYSDNSIIIQ